MIDSLDHWKQHDFADTMCQVSLWTGFRSYQRVAMVSVGYADGQLVQSDGEHGPVDKRHATR
jgi:hypothetical protein